VVISVTPSSGNCAVLQDVLITGACFTFTTPNPLAGQPGQPATIIGTVTSVFAKELGGTQVIQAQDFTILNANLLDAHFNFTSANAGKTFVIFVTGTGGTSRGLTTATGTCAALGNEGGVLANIEFTCSAAGSGCPAGVPLPGCPCPSGVAVGTNGCVGTPIDVALVNGCKLERNAAGKFILDVFGKNLKPNADVKVGAVTPRRVKSREPDPSFPGSFLRLTLKGGICNGLPGAIVVTNPASVPGGPTVPSQPFACTESCPVN
jgi:hypothetical protein